MDCSQLLVLVCNCNDVYLPELRDMLSGFAAFRWCELFVEMNLLRFLHPLLLLIDLGGVSSPDISVRFLVDNHLVGSAPTMSCWLLWLLCLCAPWVWIWFCMETCYEGSPCLLWSPVWPVVRVLLFAAWFADPRPCCWMQAIAWGSSGWGCPLVQNLFCMSDSATLPQ
jgi:hypothetical protein